ncbi:hypothetical protein CONPUDRAFT_125506 [Coniophora puteana RWD-64-598 SS2]|uniref:Actin-like ATPase domain-containing protein n=1 Tax=Coniophora puteana (strain RWD-64-598) TaxID=741705 RepID=A0A5M3MPP4_CONPW|nr:uncharacterized protein CONPUDRAFT_125506 [Coniophora puteana RWD-64-598 SS2]EIW80674.1 hypothetical protein CONPUDRAFT_125506 [Coniophora puteana RWD-64-598 SS2]
MLDRQPYHGLSRKLVLAFDVGTTFSGVSYCILDPGEVPKIQGVSKYPGQVGGDTKIPSILYYDKNRKVCAIGPEADQEQIVEKAEDEGWTKVEWWKMHLRPKHLASAHIKDNDIPPLPKGVTAVQVLADFMAYLFRCAKAYIKEHEAHGASILASVADSIDFVLSHPNGWEGPQQTQIRRAAVLAGLIPDSAEGQKRITLVTEGEASLHYCVSNVFASDVWARVPIEKSEAQDDEEDVQDNEDKGVIIVDAGGGTIDLSAYAMKAGTKSGRALSFEEIAPTECRLQGSIFVTRRAVGLLQEKLRGSPYGAQDFIKQMKGVFDTTTKHRFRDASEPYYLKFGTAKVKDIQYGIRSGQLKLDGKDLAPLFDPAVESVLEAIQQQKRTSTKSVSFVFLVGGFAANDYLFKQLQDSLGLSGICLSRPDGHMNKAVADGAVSFYIDHIVTSRTARFTYGAEAIVPYVPWDSGHLARSHKQFMGVDGEMSLGDAFSSILLKGERVSETQEFSSPYSGIGVIPESLHETEVEILAYRGPKTNPQWMDKEKYAFSPLCTIRADTSAVAPTPHPRKDQQPGMYWSIDYDVVLLFGLTELQAQISWIEEGVEKRSPATVVYDDEVEKSE